MPIYRVYEIQEEITLRKWLYEVEADCEEDAIDAAKSGNAAPEEQGSIGVPEYATSGWSVGPENDSDDDGGWDKALTELETRRAM